MEDPRSKREPKIPGLPGWGRIEANLPFRKRPPPAAKPARGSLKGRVVRRTVESEPKKPRRIVAMASRLPVIGRLAPPPPPKPAPKPTPAVRLRKILGAPRRLLGKVQAEPPPPQPARSIPFVSPVVRRVRQPLASTARMVQVAREARKPKSPWSRMRDAARLLVEGGGASSRMERVAGLAIAASAPAAPLPKLRSPLDRVLGRPGRVVEAPEPPRGLRARLIGAVGNAAGKVSAKAGTKTDKKRADAGKSPHRPGSTRGSR